MSKLIIKKDGDTYWLYIKSEKNMYSAMINLATVGKFPGSSVEKAIEEAIESQE